MDKQTTIGPLGTTNKIGRKGYLSIGDTMEDKEKKAKDIISKLRFLAGIDKGEKLVLPEMTLIKDTWYNNIYRTFSGNGSKEETLSFIDALRTEALSIAEYYIESDTFADRCIRDLIIQGLKDSKSGIMQMMGTYASKKMYIAEVDTSNIVLEAKLKDLEEKIKRFEA